jgi:hypothetical protein
MHGVPHTLHPTPYTLFILSHLAILSTTSG